jgi:hypothetical protein
MEKQDGRQQSKTALEKEGIQAKLPQSLYPFVFQRLIVALPAGF